MKHITAYMAGIALFFPIKIIVALDSAYSKHIKQLRLDVFLCRLLLKIIRHLVTGGGHLELPHEMFGRTK